MAHAASQRKETTEGLSKKELQKEMAKTREAVSETVGEIKETVSKQYQAAKETVAGVLDYREQFQNEPLVWSLGALSAGFALGYTMGYAHKETRGSRNRSEVSAFANSMVDELSQVGNNLIMPTLNARIQNLFGFDFSEVLESIGKSDGHGPKRKTRRIASTKKAGTKKRSNKTRS